MGLGWVKRENTKIPHNKKEEKVRISAKISKNTDFFVRVGRFERPVSWSQTKRDTNFATPGYLIVRFLDFLLSVVIPVVKRYFEVNFKQQSNPVSDRVARAFGVPPSPAPDAVPPLPKQARYQLRYTRVFAFSVSENSAVCGHSCGQTQFQDAFQPAVNPGKRLRPNGSQSSFLARPGYRPAAPKRASERPPGAFKYSTALSTAPILTL